MKDAGSGGYAALATLRQLAGPQHRRVQDPGCPRSEQLGRPPGLTFPFLAGIDDEVLCAADFALEVLRVEADVPHRFVDLAQFADRELVPSEGCTDHHSGTRAAPPLGCDQVNLPRLALRSAACRRPPQARPYSSANT